MAASAPSVSLAEPQLLVVRSAAASVVRLAAQLALLWLILAGGGALSQALALPLPGNLAGMLLLLALLWSGVIRLSWVQDLSAMLVRHLMLFFVPLAVGLMVWQNLLATSGVIIGLSLVGSAAVGMLTAGLVAQRLAGGRAQGQS